MIINNKIHQRLKQINTKLTAIEKQIYTTVVRLDATLQYELNNSIEGLWDYELQAEIECYNSEEELICTLKEYMKGISLPEYNRYYAGDGINHNEFQYRENHPMKDEVHCWLYHCLYDHVYPDLTWEQISSIETFCIDIVPRYQYTKSLHISK